MRPTYHLVPTEVWDAADAGAPYAPPSLTTEGFVHCTDGVAALLATGDRYYRDDPRSYVVLTIDLDRAGSPWRFDDGGPPYPHVYGPIDPAAILEVHDARRDETGSFTGLDRRAGAPSTGRPA